VGVRIEKMQGCDKNRREVNKVSMTVLCLLFTLAVTTGGCFSRSPVAPPAIGSTQLGVYEFEVGNSLYPKSRGASKGFQRYLSSGERVTGSLEWKESYAVHYKWSLYIYAPDGTVALEWNGADLKHKFHFTPTESGTYKLEILKRDFRGRVLRLTIDPPDWNRWGKE
jgi:hypothetical protein